MDIQQALMLIEQYVTFLQAEDLNAAYDRAARNLLVFLPSRAWLQDLLAGEFCQHLDGFKLQGDRPVSAVFPALELTADQVFAAAYPNGSGNCHE